MMYTDHYTFLSFFFGGGGGGREDLGININSAFV